MGAQAVLQQEAIQVYDYRCSAGPGDRPFAELHEVHSLAYVRQGSFGYRVRGQAFELVAGSILVGRLGDEYVCTHDHHVCGDECLSFQLAPATLETIGGRARHLARWCTAAAARADGAGRAGAGRRERCQRRGAR